MSLRSRSTIIRFSARFFGSAASAAAQPRVALRVGVARRRPLHRPRLDPARAVEREEELGRARDERRAGQRHQRPVPDRLAGRQRRLQRRRLALPAAAERQRQVRLVDVAGADVVRHPPERRGRRRRSPRPAGTARAPLPPPPAPAAPAPRTPRTRGAAAAATAATAPRAAARRRSRARRRRSRPPRRPRRAPGRARRARREPPRARAPRRPPPAARSAPAGRPAHDRPR